MSSICWLVLQINDGTDVLETMIEPLLDLCVMENVSIFILNFSIIALFQITCKIILLSYLAWMIF